MESPNTERGLTMAKIDNLHNAAGLQTMYAGYLEHCIKTGMVPDDSVKAACIIIMGILDPLKEHAN